LRAGAPSHRPRRAEDGAGHREDDKAKLQMGVGDAEDGAAHHELGARRVEVGCGEVRNRILKLENNDAEIGNNRVLAAFW
jgi:hypothetical protein